MVLVLSRFGNKYVLCGANEHFVAKTNTHPIIIAWILGALLGFGACVWAGIVAAQVTRTFAWIIVGFLFSLPFGAIFTIFLLFHDNDVILTDRNLFWVRWGRAGIWRLREIPLENVTSIQIKQSPLGSLLKYGDIFIQLTVSPQEQRLRWIPAPVQFMTTIEKAILMQQELPQTTSKDVQEVLTNLQAAYERHMINEKQFQYFKGNILNQTT